MVMQKIWQVARQRALVAALAGGLGLSVAGSGASSGGAMAHSSSPESPAAAGAHHPHSTKTDITNLDWQDHFLSINVTEISCRDYLDITIDGRNGENLAIWIDGWLTGEFMGSTFHKPDVRARLQHWREHCLIEPNQPLLKVLRGTRFEAGASSEAIGDATNELRARETIVIQGYRCINYIELTESNPALAEQLTRWLDGWHAGGANDPFYRPNKIAEQTKGLLGGCYRNVRKTLIKASEGKFR